MHCSMIMRLVVLALPSIHAHFLWPVSPHHRLVNTQTKIKAELKSVLQATEDGRNVDQFEQAVNTTLHSVSNLIVKAKSESTACCNQMNLALDGLEKSASNDKSADRTTVKLLYEEIAAIRLDEMVIMGYFRLLESNGMVAKLKWKERKGISKAKREFHNALVEQTGTLTKRLDVIASRVKAEPEPKQPSRDSIGLEVLRRFHGRFDEIKREFKFQFDGYRQETNRRFDETHRRFDETHRLFDEIKSDFKLRFDDHRQEMNRRFDERRQETNRHFANIRSDINKGFDRQRRHTDKSIQDLHELHERRKKNAINVSFNHIWVVFDNGLQFAWSEFSKFSATVKQRLGISHSPKRLGSKRK